MAPPARHLPIFVVAFAAGLGVAGPGHAAAAPAAATTALAPSAFALPVAGADAAVAAAGAAGSGAEPAGEAAAGGVAAGAWRSLVVPGWGQVYQGHRDLGLAFGTLEAALITTLFVSVGQGHLRRGASEETAALFAGIDVAGRDDTYRRRVSDYHSSDEYNRLVIYRDAAYLYYGDPVKYDLYIQEHALTGEDAWVWESDEAWAAYRQQRRASESAFQRARFAVAGMVVNRVASAITAAAMARKHPGGRAAAADGDGVALCGFEWSVQPAADFGIEHRLAWVHRF
jgi:hypothetical protein